MISQTEQINQLYDKFYIEQIFSNDSYLKNAEFESKFIIDTLKIPRTSKLLDLPCGAGAHSRFLADYFDYVEAVDLSSACIEFAKNFNHKSNISYQEMDIKDFVLLKNSKFDIVTNLGMSIGYSKSINENDLTLGLLAQLVNKNGYLILQYLNKNWCLNKFKFTTTFWSESDSYYILDKRQLTDNKTFLQSVKIFVDKNSGAIRRYEDTVYLYDLVTLVTKLENNGLSLIQSYDSCNGSPIDEEKSSLPTLIFQK